LSKKDIESAIESVPLSRNCQPTVQSLKDNGFITGIISDSYTVATEFVARRLGLDFVSANNIEIKNGKLTGNVEMPLGWQFIDCFCKISVCKRFHLEKSAREFNVEMKNTVAVGDTKSDICMIQKAGVGIAYMPKDDYISKSTPNLVLSPDFANILKYVTI
jgi:phosphoserine phosphatase